MNPNTKVMTFPITLMDNTMLMIVHLSILRLESESAMKIIKIRYSLYKTHRDKKMKHHNIERHTLKYQ